MRIPSSVIVLCLILCPNAVAQNSPSPAERLKTVQAEVAAAERAFRDAQARGEGPELDKARTAFSKKQSAGWSTALEIGRKDPTSDVAIDALVWILSEPGSCNPDGLLGLLKAPPGVTAIELLTRHHITSPRIGSAIAMLGYFPPQLTGRSEAMKLVEAVAERNPSRDIRGQAVLGLAWRDSRAFTDAERRGDTKAMDRAAAVAQASFEKVLRDYGDCPNLRSVDGMPARTATLGEEAQEELYELKNLRIGLVAPEIVGKDLSGAEFRLSEYRGKVVLLVFWASWCGPCMADVPHEKDLVRRFSGGPFVLIGVNGDDSIETAARVVSENQIPWRSFWNGEKGATGPISRQWNVRAWPTTYLIDADGVIRHKHLRGGKLDEPIRKLVAEGEAARGR